MAMAIHPDNKLRSGALNPDPPPPSSVAIPGIESEEQRKAHVRALGHELASLQHELQVQGSTADLKARAQEVEEQLRIYEGEKSKRRRKK
jgi:hypothetical protein